MPAAPHPADVHAGATPEQILDGFRQAFAAVVDAAAGLALRPGAVEVHTQLGLLDVAVYFPSSDVAAVDALADKFGLPADDGAHQLYTRSGFTALGEEGVGMLTVRTLRPGVELPDPLAAVEAPTDDPVVITGELAAVDDTPTDAHLALPAGARGELVVP